MSQNFKNRLLIAFGFSPTTLTRQFGRRLFERFGTFNSPTIFRKDYFFQFNSVSLAKQNFTERVFSFHYYLPLTCFLSLMKRIRLQTTTDCAVY